MNPLSRWLRRLTPVLSPGIAATEDIAGTIAIEHFSILYVCSANLCRSMMAERVTRRRLVGAILHGQVVRASSAGLRAIDGQHAISHAVDALARTGTDAAGFSARRLSRALLAESDLVLTAETAHRDRAAAMLPSAARRVFTLREFARLGARVPPRPRGVPQVLPAALGAHDVVAQARTAVLAAAAMRGQVDLVDPARLDIRDPRGGPAAFRACLREVSTAVDGCLRVLLPNLRS